MRSSALATVLVSKLGYARVARLVHDALASGQFFVEAAIGCAVLREEDVEQA